MLITTREQKHMSTRFQIDFLHRKSIDIFYIEARKIKNVRGSGRGREEGGRKITNVLKKLIYKYTSNHTHSNTIFTMILNCKII